MNKKALISVKSIQDEKNDEIIEVVTPGDFYNDNEKYYVEYDETEISGMEGTKTIFEIDPGKFTLIRNGTTATKMEFEDKSENFVMYNTPYGMIEMKIMTQELSINVNDNGGDVKIKYDMVLPGEKPLNTTLDVNIKLQ
ncbi:MAG: DUF1934 domain-containing protein [Bacillota bacterium]|nr:DUF1934 domain-containing protein [Bacillota bacterium]